MLCDNCCDSTNVKKLIESNGDKLENETTCPRCSSTASWSISHEKFIDALSRIVANRYVPVEGPLNCFSSLELKKAENYRNAWSEYESLQFKPQKELYEDEEELYEDEEELDEDEEELDEDEEELDEDALFEISMENSKNIQDHIAKKYDVDFEDLQQEYFDGYSLFHRADNIISQVLNPSHSACTNKIYEFIPELNYDESRFFYALHNPEEEIYWIDKPIQVIHNVNDKLWDEYVNIIRTKSRFFIEQHKRANEILEVFGQIIKASQNLYHEGRKVYRARIANNKDTEIKIHSYPAKELNSAPVDFAAYNRFSPAGISYAYASFDEKTAVEEIRPNNMDIVYIGVYRLEDKKYIDFSSSMIERYCNDFDPFYKEVIAHNKEFVLNFIENIRKPTSNDYQKIDYVPTQILSEYIKLNGYHGIIFDSSLTGERNVVYFGAFSKYESYKRVEVKLLTTFN